ncbi:MAG: ABC transporter ATP-binding protein [Bdellovibrionaceae bacterium]|nr:ABC transporter ATP-binding protein [Pseudobdellovibrionaceae bacterium]
MSALKVVNLEKELGVQKSLILKKINFEVNEGEFVSLTGKSGSGKSTLLYVLSTLDWPTRGQVFYGDHDVQSLSSKELHSLRNENIGFVFQFHYLLPELTALENVLMPARKAGILEEKIPFAQNLLELVGLGERMDFLPRELSGGQSQRVSIARSLIMNPKFLFADEPTGSLDSANSKLILDIFKEINQDYQTTIIMVTHDADLAQATDRQIHLVDGTLDSMKF